MTDTLTQAETLARRCIRFTITGTVCTAVGCICLVLAAVTWNPWWLLGTVALAGAVRWCDVQAEAAQGQLQELMANEMLRETRP